MEASFDTSALSSLPIGGSASLHGQTHIHQKNIHNVTCSDKGDHLGLFIDIEFLVWVDSLFCTEYNGDGFKRKKPIKNSNCIMKYISEQLITSRNLYYKCTVLASQNKAINMNLQKDFFG